ncbi:helix-turn-helix domain-containing protein [Lactococcus lactis]|jgi:transcriptional regulator with XRE-family HTH domain|uniref:helix-turn-helix domain-containing protein n=1 Tax=Lactococcus lactis TaxID=1358 RepID=UPI002069EDDB|nr:helix-turn-helix transcriptional regulator [Lactococcus lactis]WKF73446.1 helix-turn-helix transcriptional regulator [Lactococcus lactis]BDH80609.1 hypothetical protein LLL8_02660 [Lactococcus lactis]
MSVFAERLKELRKEKGLTQSQLAIKFGVRQGAINKWESGKTEPNFEKLVMFADYFDVSTDYLLGRKNESN